MPQPAVTPKAAPVITGEGTASATPASTEPQSDPTVTVAAPDKPYLVFVTDGNSKESDDVEKVLLEDDKIELGSRAFHAVKMSPDQASQDALLKDKGGKLVPRVIFVTADLKNVKPIEGTTLKVSEVWGAMKVTANKFYKTDLEAMVKGLQEVCNEFNKIYKAGQVLDDKEKRLGDKATPADKKELETKRTELTTRTKKNEEKRDKLGELKPRDAASAEKPA